MKCMECWDGVPCFDGKTMPQFTTVSLYFCTFTCIICLDFGCEYILLFNLMYYCILVFVCRNNFKHIDKILFVNGFFTTTMFVDKLS